MNIFLSVAEVSLALSPLILLTALLSRKCSGRYPPRVFTFLWLVFAVRLLVPLNYHFGFGLLLTPPVDPVSGNRPPLSQVLPDTRIFSGLPATPQKASVLSAGMVVVGLWLLGVALCLLFHLIGHWRMRRQIRRWRLPPDAQALHLLERLRQELRIKQAVALCRTPELAAPFLVGLFHPLIVLPDTDLTSDELEHILRHELTHLRRGDLWYKLVLLVASALHWFNPLVHLLAVQADQDLELACDQEAISGYSREDRRAYGETLLALLAADNRKKLSLTTGFSGKKQSLARRIARLVDSTPKQRGYLLIAAGILLVVCVSGFIAFGDTGREASAAVPEAESLAPAGESVSAQSESPSEADTDSAGADPQHLVVQPYSQAMITEDSAVKSEVAEDVDNATPMLFIWPTSGGKAITFENHAGNGVDIARATGDPIYAAASGTIVKAVNGYTGYGRYLVVDHGNGYKTLYAHCSELYVSVGEVVNQGQVIAAVGRTGWATANHLHFEVHLNSQYMNPFDYIGESATGE